MKEMRKIPYGSMSDVELPVSFTMDLLEPYLINFMKERTRNEYRRHILTICAYFGRKRGYSYSFEELDEADAKEYFLEYLIDRRNRGEISDDTIRLRLSVCRNFSVFLEERIDYLIKEGNTSYPPYKSPFMAIIPPAAGELLDVQRMVSTAEIDIALYKAKQYDVQLYIVFLLSFRMLLKQTEILTLKKEHFTFVRDGNRDIGIITLLRKGQQVFERIPIDCLKEIKAFVLKRQEGYIFLNQYDSPMNRVNLSTLLKRFHKDTGMRIQLSQLRSRGMIDLISQNPDDLDAISDYTGLSKQMIAGYGKVLQRFEDDCIADRSGYVIISRRDDIE